MDSGRCQASIFSLYANGIYRHILYDINLLFPGYGVAGAFDFELVLESDNVVNCRYSLDSYVDADDEFEFTDDEIKNNHSKYTL